MKKKLTKSKDKRIFGVCGGIAEYFDIDPVFLRIVWGVALICLGVGGVAYLVAALVMPTPED